VPISLSARRIMIVGVAAALATAVAPAAALSHGVEQGEDVPIDGKKHYVEGLGYVKRVKEDPNALYAPGDQPGADPAVHTAEDPTPSRSEAVQTDAPAGDPSLSDLPPESAESGGLVALPSSANNPVCAAAGTRRVYVVYSHPEGVADRYDDKVAAIRNRVQRMNWKLIQEGYRSSGNQIAAQYRVRCASGTQTIYVSNIESKANAGGSGDPDPNSALNIRNSVEEVLGTPTGSQARKYLILAEKDSGTPTGWGWFADYERHWIKDASLNYNNNRTSSAVIFEEQWGLHNTVHEVGHTLGAVNVTYPKATSNAHCIDGWDLMCYRDGSTEAASYTESACSSGSGYNTPDLVPFDCRKDTFFDTSTEAGENLRGKWNLGWSGNGFFQFSP